MSDIAVGTAVRVKESYPIGHVRTPYYCRGLSGHIERRVGKFHNPEELAYGRTDHTPITLYRVRFQQKDIWPDYQGPTSDTVDIEIYEHWLEVQR